VKFDSVPIIPVRAMPSVSRLVSPRQLGTEPQEVVMAALEILAKRFDLP